MSVNSIYISIGIVVLAAVVGVCYMLVVKCKRKKIDEKILLLQDPIKNFYAELTELQKFYITDSIEKAFVAKWKDLYSNVLRIIIPKKHSSFSELENFKAEYISLHDTCWRANEKFIQTESDKYDEFFSNIDGKSLDYQQRTAVIADDERILVLAGAGSGKTLTIAAKVKYLCEVKLINPKDILLISFTKKSALEMTERIKNKLGILAEATTFHKLGLDIIKNADGRRPEVSDENVLNRFVLNFFDNNFLNFPDLIKKLTEFFSYFLEIPEKMENYSSLGELYEEEKNSRPRNPKIKV